MDAIQLAAVLAGAALLASMVSVEIGIAVALLEVGFGVVIGNVFSLHSQPWLDFVASFAAVLITAVVMSAIIPTAIAQWRYAPIADLERSSHPLPAEEYV